MWTRYQLQDYAMQPKPARGLIEHNFILVHKQYFVVVVTILLISIMANYIFQSEYGGHKQMY